MYSIEYEIYIIRTAYSPHVVREEKRRLYSSVTRARSSLYYDSQCCARARALVVERRLDVCRVQQHTLARARTHKNTRTHTMYDA